MSKDLGIDWPGLLNWSTKFYDGTSPSNVQPMSPEELQWLTEALKQYTYDDTDKLKDLITAMQKDVENNFEKEKGATQGDDLYDMID